MQLKELSTYADTLYYCRFCPMCKPAADVANVTCLESHSTRGRAVLLWRIATGLAGFSPRAAELLYQSTLDTVSESWCVNHFPVSKYVISARAEAVEKGMIPEPVKKALADRKAPGKCPRAETVFLAAEAAEMGGSGLLKKAGEVLSSIGVKAATYSATTGVLPFVLGDIPGARRQAELLAAALKEAGVKEVIADGPQTLFGLTVAYAALGVALPDGLKVRSLTEMLFENKNLVKGGNGSSGKKVFVHDGQSAFFLGDSLATDEVLQPGMSDNEPALGTGKIYDMPREIVDAAGMERVFGVWSRSVAKSSGSDDGLWITYPDLALKLAEQRIGYAKQLGAETIATDSLSSAEFLGKTARKQGSDIDVVWLPELF